MASYGGGFSSALTRAVLGGLDKREEIKKADMAEAIRQQALKRQAELDAEAKAERADAKSYRSRMENRQTQIDEAAARQKMLENLKNGIVEGGATATVTQAGVSDTEPLTGAGAFNDAAKRANLALPTAAAPKRALGGKLLDNTTLGGVPQTATTVTGALNAALGGAAEPVTGRRPIAGNLPKVEYGTEAPRYDETLNVDLQEKRAILVQQARQTAAQRANDQAFQAGQNALGRQATIAAAGIRSTGSQGSRGTTQMMRLASAYDSDPVVKDAKDVAMGLSKVRSAAADPSPAGDLSLLYGYNKLLDPGSVVRESEFATAAKAGSLDTRIQGYASRVIRGERLTPGQRADFIKQAEAIARSQQKLVKETMDRQSARARRMGVDPRDIVYDPFEDSLSEPVQSDEELARGMVRAGKSDAEIAAALAARRK